MCHRKHCKKRCTFVQKCCQEVHVKKRKVWADKKNTVSLLLCQRSRLRLFQLTFCTKELTKSINTKQIRQCVWLWVCLSLTFLFILLFSLVFFFAMTFILAYYNKVVATNEKNFKCEYKELKKKEWNQASKKSTAFCVAI